MNEKKKPVMVAWERTSKNGNIFLSCKAGEKSLVAFKNFDKRNPKGPDWEFFENEPMQKKEEPKPEADLPW